MSSLSIRWQRLVKDGRTCDRCRDTESAVRRAAETLRQVLEPLGIEAQLDVADLDEAAFRASAGLPMEDWLEGTVGQSRCCSVCGDSDCRTVKIQGTVFETIPERLIIKAGLRAAAELLDPTTLPIASTT
jgi:hypothetical protein